MIATCGLCGQFVVPWGDHIGEALMREHQRTDCPRDKEPDGHHRANRARTIAETAAGGEQ